MDKIIDFIEKQGFLPVVLIVGAFLLLALVIMFAVALLQGREVAIGPLRLGGHQKGDSAITPSVDPNDATSSQYSINCYSCGTLIPVSNPRLNEVPRKVYPKTNSCSSGGSSEGFRIGCPNCKSGQFVQFEY